METQNIELVQIKTQCQILKMREIHLNEVSKCLELQESLTELEMQAFSKRTQETYTQIIEEGIAIGLFSESNNLIAQIATDLSSDKKPYIKSQNEKIQSMLEQECYIEVGAAIVHKDYRKQGLLKILIQQLETQILKLISNESLLEQKNRKLQEFLKNKALFLVAGCNAENYASGLSFMNTGFSLIGNVEHKLNENQQVQGYIFMKEITETKKVQLTKNKTAINSLIDNKKDPLPLNIVKDILSKKSAISKTKEEFTIDSVI